MSEVQKLQVSSTEAQNDETTPRACESCRIRKVRCLQDTSLSSAKCLPCAKSHRDCVFTARSRTRRRKRTDTRVADLEKEVKAMTALLKRKNLGSAEISTETGDRARSENGDQNGRNVNLNHNPNIRTSRSTMSFGASQSPQDNVLTDQNTTHNTPPSGQYEEPGYYSTLPDDNQYAPEIFVNDMKNAFGLPAQLTRRVDVVDRGLLTMTEATAIYNRYIDELIPQLPIIIVPRDAAEIIRRDKPTLFLAVIAAASATEDEDLYLTLNKELLQIYADKITIRGEKSLELVQSMLLTVVWCCPPDNFDSMKFYQYIHMAASMALDLGIGRKPQVPSKQSQFSVLTKENTLPSDSIDKQNGSSTGSRFPAEAGPVESRRTILACYLMCSSVSISLRRPNMLRFSNYMNECEEYLETSSDAAPTDKRLVAWVKLQRIMEEVGNVLSFDDPNAIPSLAETRIQLVLKGFEKQMEGWKISTAREIMNQSLYMNYFVNHVHLHEISMHPDHNAEDFRPPFVVKTAMQSIQVSLSPSYIEAVMTCVSSTHTFLNIFLEMPIKTVRALPIFQMVRIIYGVIVLIKLSLSASTPTSEIGKTLDHESLKVTYYMDKLLVHLMRALGPEKNRVASKFLAILMTLKSWFSQQTLKLSTLSGDTEGFQPLQNLTPIPETVLGKLYPSQPALAYQTSHETPQGGTMAQGGRPNQQFFETDAMVSSQQQHHLSYDHYSDSPNRGITPTPLVPRISHLQDFRNPPRTDQTSLPGFSIAVDPTALPTYEDPFNAMDLEPDQFFQYENINFSAEELDAWITSQGMPGIVSAISPEPHD